MPLRFLQLSDLHLDSSLASGRLGLPLEKVRQRQREIRAIVPAAVALARDRHVGAVFLPGDLFDDESISLDTVNFVIDNLASLAPIPVFIAPGNHDFYSLGSPYNDEFLVERRQSPWPANVCIFRKGTWEVAEHPELPGVSVTGIAHTAGVPIGERLLAAPIPRGPSEGLRILLFHGSRDRADLPRGKSRTLPFSDDELESQGFDYAAIGHYHERAYLRASDGRILGAYAGCTAGRGIDEAGEKGVLIGEIDRAGGSPGAAVKLERVALDRRRIHVIEVACTGLTHRDAILKRAEESVSLRGCRPEDVALIRLTGRVAPGIDLRFPDAFLPDRLFHSIVDSSHLRPAYDLERYRREEGRTTEARFARQLLERIEAVEDSSERRILENALYYGLDALIQKDVAPRYED